jgi:D-psicose/D-tagatose/L-ribulose 3-epimerase
MGATLYSGALYGHPGVVKRRLPPADEYPRTAEGLHQLAAHAQRRGVTIALEPMSRFRTHLVNTPEQVMRLVALADHPNLSVLLDTYHGQRGARLRAGDPHGAPAAGPARLRERPGLPGGGLCPGRRLCDFERLPLPVLLLKPTIPLAIAYWRGLFQTMSIGMLF